MPLAEGQELAGYTVVRSLGAGGMGEVYLVQHPRLPRYDALKVLAATVCADGEYRERFNREAEIAATLWHPHIVEIHDRGDVDGQLWIAMDYVDGTDAGELLGQYPGGMPPALAVRMVTAVAEALDYAHGKGLTHRDVKPANLLIANPDGPGERILLADFGIARRADDTSNLTGTNMTVGTVAYAAPEQLTGEKVDGRADQYALAATAYQLLTGAPPFQHSNPAVVISQHLTGSPPPIGSRRPELAGLGPVFDRALAKSPADRYDRCVDFARALGHCATSAGVAAPEDCESTMRAGAAAPSGPRHAKPQPAPSGRRKPVWLALAASAVLVAVVVAGLLAFDVFGGRRDVAQPAAGVAVPVVVVGADCATLGAAGVTEKGAPAYCAHLQAADVDMWSLQEGQINAPTVTTAAGAPSADPPVLVCMEQTGGSQSDCRSDIARENADPAANDTTPPTA
ncbi:serine/threonine-protein kinase [Mycolicibacterium grossiae]|uniref:non-specific serine/threonine protein kinase n=1 Tax=Mycolicibacterium grossiae TaxID=1552759 RepID=A0A1E8Q6R8_9MYCO|nr:serine/threonine-protein kinase [Mycolicibacterium grossiae]OFJ53941.1 serine/threonine protein kinase [Mycolicibacterium grossiae]QEM44146.1 serine/threonine protein kinase [Mycolicibacterium grossiae]